MRRKKEKEKECDAVRASERGNGTKSGVRKRFLLSPVLFSNKFILIRIGQLWKWGPNAHSNMKDRILSDHIICILFYLAHRLLHCNCSMPHLITASRLSVVSLMYVLLPPDLMPLFCIASLFVFFIRKFLRARNLFRLLPDTHYCIYKKRNRFGKLISKGFGSLGHQTSGLRRVPGTHPSAGSGPCIFSRNIQLRSSHMPWPQLTCALAHLGIS